MAKTPNTSAKTKKKSPVTAKKAAPTRKLVTPKYQSFRLQKRIKGTALPSAFRLFRQMCGVLLHNWKVVGGIVLLYGVLNVILVQGFSAANDLTTTKSTFDQLFSGHFGHLISGAGLFVYLLGSSGNTSSPTAGTYQLFLILIFSVAFIWVLRQLYAGHTVRIRDGFYQGVGPLVRFMLVLAVVGLQLLPFIIGVLLYSMVTSSGIAASSIEQLLWATLFFVLAVISLYMLASSLFALYIVTLNDMTPLAALRSARQLVRNRRWMVLRRIIFLPITVVVLAGVLIIPLILYATSVVPWVFFGVTMLLLPIIHGYMYSLYRSLL